MKRKLYFCIYVLIITAIIGCNNQSKSGGDEEHSNIIEIAPYMIDSVTTNRILMEALITNNVDITPWQNAFSNVAELYTTQNLEYLPYLMLTYQHPDRIPPECFTFVDFFVEICTGAMYDKNLFNYGRKTFDKIKGAVGNNRFKYLTREEYPISFADGEILSKYYTGPFVLSEIDTLRVQSLIHNDRDALQELERYYQDKGDTMGIAIYYKVLLSYEGNGDLAERFFKVLEPHFEETPELRSAVREVLLRAALCDHNARAQELCDSLGFSLCDYRLPLPE